MNPYIEKMKDYLERFPRERKDIESVIELLCHYYAVDHAIEPTVIRAEFQDMEPILNKLTLRDNDALFRSVLCIATAYTEHAFLSGVCTGAELVLEMQKWEP